MSNPNQAQEVYNGQVVEVPSDYNKIQGLLTGMRWDGNKRKSALFFFSQDRGTGQGVHRKPKWINFTVRLWEREAIFLEAIHLHKEANKAEIKNNPQADKFVALINLSVRNSSYDKPNGKTHLQNGVETPSTDSVMIYEGKESVLVDPKTKTIEAQARFHLTPEEEAAAQNQQQG
jgi:hypothetical protein